MFSVQMLPAARGDCLWIEYGAKASPHRVLIDGGIQRTGAVLRKRIEQLPETQRHLDLLVITHIDLDHIAGILALLRDPPDGLKVDDVWFNGWEHLLQAEHLTDDEGVLGAKLAERVTARLKQRGYAWNTLFGAGPVAIPDNASGLPEKLLRGGMKLTLLSPTADRLRRLLPVWEEEIVKAKLEPGSAGEDLEGIGHPEEADEGILGSGAIDVETLADTRFKDDTSQANGSSIALLAEYENRRCLFAGDAYASDIAAALQLLRDGRSKDPLRIDALKLSHHGGRKNTSPALLKMLDCPRFLFSTDGSVYDHPHTEAVARVLVHGRGSCAKPMLCFNYRSDETAAWDDRGLSRGAFPYTPCFPDGQDGLTVDL